MAGALFFTTFKTCRERIQPEQQEQTSFAEEFKQLKRNGPWLMIILISVMTVMSQAIRACTTLHYFKYVAGQEDWGTQILLYNSLAAVVAVLLSKHYCQKLGGKKRAYIILNILFAIVVSWFYFIPSDQFSMLLANQILLSFVCAPMMPIFWSMIADTADYGAVKLGHRATGVIFSAGTASQKIGWSIGPAVAMWILASSGFEANTIPSDLTKMTLKLEMSLIPAGFAILTAFATLFYSIDSKMEKELEAVLSK
jgi:GPH family glycoside/pentoside/hexuronide:cation symporter